MVERLNLLSYFLPKLTEKIRPILRLLRKVKKFKWNDKCEEALEAVNSIMSSTSVLEKPKTGSRLLLYLYIFDEASSTVLVQQ